jgi:predicted nucleic acid-binding protein
VSFGLDTSVVVRLLIGAPEDQAQRAWELLEECASEGEPVQVSALVVAESFFVLQHHYGVPLAKALQQLASLLGDVRVSADAAALRVLRTPGLARLKPGFVDRLIHQQHESEGRELATFDGAAARLARSRLLG